MALNYIWIGFFLVGFVAALAQWIFLGDTEFFKRIIDGTFDAAKMGVIDKDHALIEALPPQPHDE